MKQEMTVTETREAHAEEKWQHKGGNSSDGRKVHVLKQRKRTKELWNPMTVTLYRH